MSIALTKLQTHIDIQDIDVAREWVKHAVARFVFVGAVEEAKLTQEAGLANSVLTFLRELGEAAR